MMNMDYISVIDNFVETVSTPIIVIDDRFYVISSNKAAVDLLGSDFKDRHFYVAIRQPLIINLVENAFTAKGNEKENFYKTVSGVERTYEVTAEYSSELKIVSLSFSYGVFCPPCRSIALNDFRCSCAHLQARLTRGIHPRQSRL